MGLDSHAPCYEIDFDEVAMDEAILIGEVISYFNFSRQMLRTSKTIVILPNLNNQHSPDFLYYCREHTVKFI